MSTTSVKIKHFHAITPHISTFCFIFAAIESKIALPRNDLRVCDIHPKTYNRMVYDLEMLRAFYADFPQRLQQVRTVVNRPLTQAEKILFSHLDDINTAATLHRGESYGLFRPDRVAMQDATAQMAILQFMNAGREKPAVPVTVHCDHLIRAHKGAADDLATAKKDNAEVYDFLQSAAARFGFGFWQPGAGIIHQIVLENYAFPGGMMVGTDSHTPNAGGLAMAAVGVGGADAVDVMTATPWELKMPRIIGVHLSGELTGWTSAKDVILEVAGRLTVKGGTNAILEYFGEGTAALAATGKATVTNMGAEVGATTSLFAYDEQTAAYLRATGRAEVAEMAENVKADLRADVEVWEHPECFYDEVLRINLSELRPHINGPFTPDAATDVAKLAEKVAKEDWPERVEACLIGSCTNSSYQDLARAASVVSAALEAGKPAKAPLLINPGSELIRATAERDGLLAVFRRAGATILTNACGPCIGQWKRETDDPARKNAIVTSFNRNFAKRADGNPNTYAFVASPEVVAGYAFTGKLTAHPSFSEGWEHVVPTGSELPMQGFAGNNAGALCPPAETLPDASVEVNIRPDSERLQRLAPFAPWNGRDFEGLPVLIKTRGKCTTDHISMAGTWLRYRGHLENISRNLLMGAVNAFNGKTNAVRNALTGELTEVWRAARDYRDAGIGSIVVAEDNYGEGSSREHAAMEPRFLGVKAVLAKSFARIHETNLKKQGVLALTFNDPDDYDKVGEGDRISVKCSRLRPDEDVEVLVMRTDGSCECFYAHHTYNAAQIAWFRAGAALNVK